MSKAREIPGASANRILWEKELQLLNNRLYRAERRGINVSHVAIPSAPPNPGRVTRADISRLKSIRREVIKQIADESDIEETTPDIVQEIAKEEAETTAPIVDDIQPADEERKKFFDDNPDLLAGTNVEDSPSETDAVLGNIADDLGYGSFDGNGPNAQPDNATDDSILSDIESEISSQGNKIYSYPWAYPANVEIKLEAGQLAWYAIRDRISDIGRNNVARLLYNSSKDINTILDTLLYRMYRRVDITQSWTDQALHDFKDILFAGDDSALMEFEENYTDFDTEI